MPFYPLSKTRENLSLGFPQNELITFVLFFISHDLNMIDPIYAHYYFSVISHFGSSDRIKVLIFSTVNQDTLFQTS